MMLDQSVMNSGQNDISAALESFRKPLKTYKEISYLPQNIFEIERVLDWGKRIENYNERQKNKYKLAF